MAAERSELGRRVAVTGGGGFIGSHLITNLLAKGTSVVLLGPVSMTRTEVIEAIATGAVDYRASALTGGEEELKQSLVGCDALVHLGYRAPKGKDHWARLEEEVRANLVETIRLLKASASSEIDFACFASSAYVYTLPVATAVNEEAPVGGEISPYGKAKLAQEWCFQDWARLTGAQTAILRIASVYGPGETVSRAIPNFIRAVIEGRSPSVDGPGTREFDPVFVRDVAEAFSTVISRRAQGVYNIGTGVGWTSREIAAMVMRLCGVTYPVHTSDLPERGGPVCDVSLAERELGFVAPTPLEVGLLQEIRFVREWCLRGWSFPLPRAS